MWRESGTLPEAGGLMDQPATWVEAASTLAGLVDEANERRRRREDRMREQVK